MATYNLVAIGDSITQTVRDAFVTWAAGSASLNVGDSSALRVGDTITAQATSFTPTLVGKTVTSIVNSSTVTINATNPIGLSQFGTVTIKSLWKYDQQVKDALAAAYPSDTFNLVNNGASGWTSNDLISNFSTIAGDETPSVVMCMIGTNDAYRAREGAPGDGANYSPDQVRARVRSLITQIRALTGPSGYASRVILMTPPPASEQADGFTLWRHQETLNSIAGAVMDSASGIGGVSVIDVWRLLQDASPTTWKTDYLYDGLHVNQAGHTLIAGWVLPTLIAELKGGAPTSRAIYSVASYASSRTIDSATATATRGSVTASGNSASDVGTTSDSASRAGATASGISAADVGETAPPPPPAPGYSMYFDLSPFL